jgi:hypothetical protein
MRKPIKKPVIHEIPKHDIQRGDITAHAKGHRKHVYHPTKGWRLIRSYDGVAGREMILDFIQEVAPAGRAITGGNGERRNSTQHKALLAKREAKLHRRMVAQLNCHTVKWA